MKKKVIKKKKSIERNVSEKKKIVKKEVSKKKVSVKKIKIKKVVDKKKSFNKKIIKKKPVKLSPRISSGIPGLDKLIEGGFIRNSTNLVVGGTGSAKSIFGVQFLIEGIKKNDKVLYITFEEKKKEFYSNMKDLGFNLEELEKKEKFFFIEYTPEKVRTMLEEGGGIIESLILIKKVQRIVIDSITSFELLFGTDIETRESSLALYNMLRKWNCTTVLTYQGDPQKKTRIVSSILEFGSDSIILLYLASNKSKRERYLEVLKMRGTNHSMKTYSFSIKKKGIVIGRSVSVNLG